MSKKQFRQILWDFFFKYPKGKWEAWERAVNRGLIVFTEIMLWVVGMFTANIQTVVIVHIAVLTGLVFLYEFYMKGK